MSMDEERPAMAPPSPGGNDDDVDYSKVPWEYSLRKYLLLLATLVATVTYTAGFSPPGGFWQETTTQDSDSEFGAQYHHLAGDPILWNTSYSRYVVFFYLNAAAFASSLVVIVLILILSVRNELSKSGKRWLGPLGVLRGFMVLDLLSLIGAYTVGIYRDRDVPVYTMVLGVLTVVYLVVLHMVLPCRPSDQQQQQQQQHDDRGHKEREKPRKALMLLATFAVSVTYLAGLNAPGGFWNDDKGGHQPGEPILMGGRHETRLKVFVNLNSTAFFWSLLITVQLLDKNLRLHDQKAQFRFHLLYVSIVLALLGLVGAYTAGSCRETDNTIYVTLLGVALPACIIVLLGLMNRFLPEKGNKNDQAPADGGTDNSNNKNEDEADEKARSLVLLLATLVATITYQAGLDPPGGLWEKDGGDQYSAGDPILRTTNHRRYNAFFYCNSVAFVASLVAIILVKKSLLLRTHALQAAMILDLFGLIGAYAAGSCRDVSTSIYAMALAGAVLVYVVVHVLFLTLDHDSRRRNITVEQEEKALEVVEKRRKRLLLFANLVATITYQAGLTPPGGFRTNDDVKSDEFGHHAGDPVLRYNFRLRYNAFFYCNSVSFMLSVAMILLLVNKNLYKPAIQSHAISVCTAAGMLSLVGAYAAGSSQYLKTSIKIFGLVAAILIVLLALVLILVIRSSRKGASDDAQGKTESDTPTNADSSASSSSRSSSTPASSEEEKREKQRHAQRKRLMLLGILAASVTYQAGLKPPGGMWQDDDDDHGHVAGNPVMHDNGRTRYLAFLYINSTSFVASIIVIILLLIEFLQKYVGESSFFCCSSLCSPTPWLGSLIRAMNVTVMLDLLGLLVAYAVGSSRSWKDTGYVFMLVFAVLAYIAIHVSLSYLIRNAFRGSGSAAVGSLAGGPQPHAAATRPHRSGNPRFFRVAPTPDPESNEGQVNY